MSAVTLRHNVYGANFPQLLHSFYLAGSFWTLGEILAVSSFLCALVPQSFLKPSVLMCHSRMTEAVCCPELTPPRAACPLPLDMIALDVCVFPFSMSVHVYVSYRGSFG